MESPAVRLGDVVKIVGGGTPSKSNPGYYDGGIPWVTPKDMKSWNIRSAKVNITSTGLEDSAARLVPVGSVLVVVRSGVLKHTLPIGVCRIPVAINQDMKALLCADGVYPDFIARLIQARSAEVLGWVRATTADNFPVDKLKDVMFTLPPLVEQRRIAELLDRADELRTKRLGALASIDDLTQSAFMEAFVDGVDPSWPIVTVDELLAQRKNSIRTGPFGSQLLHSEFVESGVAVLGIDNAVSNEFRWSDRRYITEEKYRKLERYTVYPGDVLITIMGTCGRAAVVPEGMPTAINTKHLCCITLNRSHCLPMYLHNYFLRHPVARSYLEKSAKGAIMSGLNMGIIRSLPVVLPPIALQQEFQARKAKIQKLHRIHMASMNELDELFASLQQRGYGRRLGKKSNPTGCEGT
jgi:type I restriction enzyme S subunit